MAEIYDMAKRLGNALARTPEYQAFHNASKSMDEDRELVELRNRLIALEESIEAALRAGQQPDEETRSAYEGAAAELQSKPGFQKVVAAQANFEKIMVKVNETMAQGMREGGESRIILSS